MKPGEALPPSVVPRLSLWDAVSIIVGIVVGTAIYRSPPMVFQNTGGPWPALGAWLVGGVLSLCGAVCYAELATSYPRDGGDYEYLSRAYGRWLGFLFGWCQLTVILSASMGTMAYAFADYAAAAWPALAAHGAWLAAAAIVALTAINAIGNVVGKTAQNLLTGAKLVGLCGIVILGFWAAPAAIDEQPQPDRPPFDPNFGLAMVFVLYAFGGWNDAAFVAAEVRDQRRNLPRALLMGTIVITLLYLAVNAAYVRVLGFEGASFSSAPAADMFDVAFGPQGRAAVSVLVMLSALGAINGMILTGSRIYATLGEDFHFASWLASWNTRTGVPIVAMAAQSIFSVLWILAVGTAGGRGLTNRVLGSAGIPAIPWDDYFGGFETLLAGSAPVFWTFFLLTGLAVFALRRHDPQIERPFRIPLYPLPALVFCATCLYMIYSSVAYAGWLALLGVGPVVFGCLLLIIMGRPRSVNKKK